MEPAAIHLRHLVEPSKRLARRLLMVAGNRLELLLLEVREERERLLHAILLALGVAVSGLLAGMVLTAAIAVLMWDLSPAAVLLTLSGIHGMAGFLLYRRLRQLLRQWETLPATLDQLRKDRGCLERNLT